MSWQLAGYGLLGVALAAGFAWYERRRPDARVVALVATLAAFAALGRIAFAALPNVKPTTDIVFFSGYALGGAPGFAVGAIAGLTSNFFFGQGPWTTWQMAGWGATGVLAAAIARLTGRRLGRVGLAGVCGVIGFAFTVTQDIGDWVTYSDHSLAQLGVYVGKGIGFDFVHAGGCVVFALAFGPAMARSIERFARRLTVTWLPAGGLMGGGRALLLVAALTLGSWGWLASQPAASGVAAATTPAGYLLSAQNADGGLGSAPGSASTALFSGWAALGLAAAGYNLADVRHVGASLLDYERTAPAGDVGGIERTILVLSAAGVSAGPQVAALQRQIRSDGSVQDQVNLTSFAVLALRAAGVGPSARTLGWLAAQQDADGGFNFATGGGASDVDDTGAALQALAGGPPAVIGRAVRFTRAQQNSDGGFPSGPGAASNAQSTAWAIQGLLAAKTGGAGVGRAQAYLRSLTASDGHVSYSRGNDQTPVWVTAQALMALAAKTLPLAPVPAPAPAAPAPAPPARHLSPAPARRHEAGTHRQAARRRAIRSPARLTLSQLAADLALADALVLAPIG